MSRKSLHVGATGQDVVIIGGGIIGAATAYFLACDTAFRGRIVVLEQDPSYAQAATALSASSSTVRSGATMLPSLVPRIATDIASMQAAIGRTSRTRAASSIVIDKLLTAPGLKAGPLQ